MVRLTMGAIFAALVGIVPAGAAHAVDCAPGQCQPAAAVSESRAPAPVVVRGAPPRRVDDPAGGVLDASPSSWAQEPAVVAAGGLFLLAAALGLVVARRREAPAYEPERGTLSSAVHPEAQLVP